LEHNRRFEARRMQWRIADLRETRPVSDPKRMDGNWESERTPPTPAAGRRLVGWTRFGYVLSALALVALGVLWHLDRTRRWETPRWDAERFERIEAAAGAGGMAGADAAPATTATIETWVVAVYPGCPHCRASLASLLERRERERLPARIVALIVDTTRRPGAALASELGADELWWDAREIWRQRWGHRVYGETLCFDPRGAFLRALAPSVSPPPSQ
jgi:hypothetical protein